LKEYQKLPVKKLYSGYVKAKLKPVRPINEILTSAFKSLFFFSAHVPFMLRQENVFKHHKVQAAFGYLSF